MNRAIHICSFDEGLGHMKRKDQADKAAVLRVLSQCGRFSVFEATANQTIARVMTSLVRQQYVAIDNKTVGYPWSNVKLTKKGEEFVAANPAPYTARNP